MLRILLGAPVAVAIFAATVGAAEEAAHRFVALPVTGVGLVSFLDDAATRVDDGETEFEVLNVLTEYAGPDQPRARVGQVARYRVACDWRAYRGPLSTSYYDGNGNLKTTKTASTALQISFYGKPAMFASAIDRACTHEAKAASATFSSVKEALAFAATTMVAPGPSPAPPPPPPPKRGESRPIMMEVPAVARSLALPEFPTIDAHRFAVVARDDAKGHTLFLDWGNMKRDGDTVVALTLAVLGDETSSPNAPRWRWTVLALRSTRFDCKGQAATVLGEAFGDSSLSFDAQPDSAHPPRTAAASVLAAAALKAACGVAPATTYGGVAEAVAVARGK